MTEHVTINPDLRLPLLAGEAPFGPFIAELEAYRLGTPDAAWDCLRAAAHVLVQSGQVLAPFRVIPPEAVVLDSKTYWRNAEGSLVPFEAIRPADQLEDEVVRKIIGYAEPLSEQISRFWQHTRTDIASFVDLMLQQYQAQRGGKKGNITLTSFNGLMKVELRVARLIEFGTDLQAAKALTDECLAGWSADSGAEIRTIVMAAWRVDEDGRVNQQALLSLLRHDFEDERWKLAMDAIRNAIRVRATKEYFRFFRRAEAGAAWEPITIALASA